MGSTVFPAPSAASKTRYVETLLSGTSWTVPAGVTYVNAKLFGAGGSGSGNGTQLQDGQGGQVVATKVNTTPGASISYAIGAGGAGSTAFEGNAGGATTFTGATSATGGTKGAPSYQYGAAPAGEGANNGSYGATNNSGAGGSGKIELEYWL